MIMHPSTALLEDIYLSDGTMVHIDVYISKIRQQVAVLRVSLGLDRVLAMYVVQSAQLNER